MPADAIKQAMDTQVRNLEEKTGKKIDEWIKIFPTIRSPFVVLVNV